MIVILNGSVGVGKTATSWKLHEKFDKSVMLDGDFIGAVHPFEIYDKKRVEYLYSTLAYLIKFHKKHGYDNFVINYVFEKSTSLDSLINKLKNIDSKIFCFWLTCDEAEQRQRILARGTHQKDWELKRYVELNKIQEAASKEGFIGEKVDTTGKTPDEVAEVIWKRVQHRE